MMQVLYAHFMRTGERRYFIVNPSPLLDDLQRLKHAELFEVCPYRGHWQVLLTGAGIDFVRQVIGPLDESEFAREPLVTMLQDPASGESAPVMLASQATQPERQPGDPLAIPARRSVTPQKFHDAWREAVQEELSDQDEQSRVEAMVEDLRRDPVAHRVLRCALEKLQF